MKLKAGIIGSGSFGLLHSTVIRELGIFALHAYADIKEEAASSRASEYGAAYYTTDYRKIIRDPDVDVVIVSTTHDSHFPIAMDAIANNKHVFMEKPLAMSNQQCGAIMSALEGKPIKFAVGHKMRFAPMVRRAKAEMPKPITIIAQMMCNRLGDDLWIQDPVKGGGNVLSQGCHIFDIVTYLAGDMPDTLYAEGGTLTHPNSELIDNIVATIRYKNGVIASITIGDAGLNNFTSKTMVQLYGGNDCINLSERLYNYARYKGKLEEKQALPQDMLNIDNDPEGFYLQMKEFHDCIVNDRQPLVGAFEGANAVRMVFAAFESVRSGQPIKL